MKNGSIQYSPGVFEMALIPVSYSQAPSNTIRMPAATAQHARARPAHHARPWNSSPSTCQISPYSRAYSSLSRSAITSRGRGSFTSWMSLMRPAAAS